jgi:hypothetical protein
MMRFFFRRRFNVIDVLGFFLSTLLIMDGRIVVGFSAYAVTLFISVLGEMSLSNREEVA